MSASRLIRGRIMAAEKYKRPDKASDLERETAFVLKAQKVLGGWVTEYAFEGIAGDREWRFDFCWPRERVALEVMGGLHHKGRRSHGSAEQSYRDYQKSAEAQICGWTVVHATAEMIRDGEAARLVIEALRRSS